MANSLETTQPETTLPEPILTSDIVYKTVGGQPLHLDILRPAPAPESTTPQAPLPAIVEIHGGGWNSGEKDGNRNRVWAHHGFFTISINYRYSTEAPFPAQIEDCRDALRWLRDQAQIYNIDTARIGAWGHSAGGHLAALLGTAGDVQAVVDICGPTDLTPPKSYVYEPDRYVEQLVGGPLNERLDLVRQANPITHIKAAAPPFLIIHARDDALVPFHHSLWLHDALKEAGADVALLAFEDGGHGLEGHWGGSEGTIEREMLSFFQRHLR